MVNKKNAVVRRWKVHLTLESRLPGIAAKSVKALVSRTLAFVEKDIVPLQVDEIHVLLTDDERIRVINKEYRRKDKATDVLSFPQLSETQLQGRSRSKGEISSYLGDLVISTDTTVRQAEEYGVSLEDELVRLVVHGLLHLCGYDHEGVPPNVAAKMRRRERSIRKALATSAD